MGSIALRKLIPPFVLFLIGIGFWYYNPSSTDISDSTESAKDTRTGEKLLSKKSGIPPKEGADFENDSADKPLTIKSIESKDTPDKKILDDYFPLRYLSDWKTDEGPMILMQGPKKKFVRGLYYYEDTSEVKGKITTTYIQKNNNKILSGYWIQSKSLKKCGFEKYGSYYWGRLAFAFKGDSFIGIWGYCEDKPSANWNGKLA